MLVLRLGILTPGKVEANELNDLLMENFKELSFEEMQEIDGGGWIADAVEWFVGGLVCGCGKSPGYAGVLGAYSYYPQK